MAYLTAHGFISASCLQSATTVVRTSAAVKPTCLGKNNHGCVGALMFLLPLDCLPAVDCTDDSYDSEDVSDATPIALPEAYDLVLQDEVLHIGKLSQSNRPGLTRTWAQGGLTLCPIIVTVTCHHGNMILLRIHAMYMP